MQRLTAKINKQGLFYCFLAGITFFLLGLIALAFLRGKNNSQVALKSLKTWQHADAPLGFPLKDGTTPSFDHRLIQLSAFDLAQLPTATHMTQPMGSRQGAFTYNAQPFGAHNQKRGGHHSGDDINGIGGMNTDLGDPIYAIARGRVIYRGEPSPSWGKTIITAHKSPEGHVYQVMYSHLDTHSAPLGTTIARGEIIGNAGTANSHYPAHLHLELRDTRGVWIGPGYLNKPSPHLSPSKYIQKRSKKSAHMLFKDPYQILKTAELKALRDNLTISQPAPKP